MIASVEKTNMTAKKMSNREKEVALGEKETKHDSSPGRTRTNRKL